MSSPHPRTDAIPPLAIPRVSLVTQVVEAIEEGIKVGRWGDSLPPERELSRLLQVSRTTIRAALEKLVRSGALRRPHLQRPLVLDRQPQRAQTVRQQIVNVLAPHGVDRLGRFELIWLDALRELLAANGATLHLVVKARAFGSVASRTWEELPAQHPGTAWILLRSSRAMQEWFEASALPTVIAGSRHDGIRLPCVETDVEGAVRHAANRLASSGHRRIAFFIEPTLAAGVSRSEAAFLACRTAGASAEVVHHGPSRDEFLQAFTRRMGAENAPTGLLVERYTHALAALTWLLGKGNRWPGPIALMSREDTASLDYSTPAISSYSFDPTLYARKLARLAVEMSQGGARHGNVHRVEPGLVRRETA